MPKNSLYGTPNGLFTDYAADAIRAQRAPLTSDVGYDVGQIWVDELGQDAYILVNIAAGAAIWNVIAITPGNVDTLTGDSGGAISPSSGNINVLGTTNQITSIGAGSTITWSLIGPYTPATYTAHGVIMGEGTSSLAASAAGTSGQVFVSGGASADGQYRNLGVNSGLTVHGVLLGENNSAIVASTAGSNGQVLLGSTAADPAFGTLTTSTGISFTTGAASLALNVKQDGFAVVPVAGTSQALAVQSAYVCANAGQVTLTLPATAAVGDVIRISGTPANVAGWKIAQNASQTVHQNASASTTGATGTVTSGAHANETIQIMCTVANTDFAVLYASDTLAFA